MANKFFDGVMNFLGLVNVDTTNNGGRTTSSDDDFDRIDRIGSKKKGRDGSNRRDDFEDAPQVNYVPRSGRTTSSNSSRRPAQPQKGTSGDDFDADDIWGSSSRPEYGTRSGSSAQNTSTGHYTSSAAGKSSSYGQDSGYRRSYSSYSSTPRSASETNNYYYGGERSMDTNDQYGAQENSQIHQMEMFRIKTVDECKDVIRALLKKRSVLLSLEDMDSMLAQRVVDTMSGATFAIGAKMHQPSPRSRSWLLTPNTVKVDDKYGNNGGSSERFL